MATTTLPDSTPPQEPAEPNYREVRRWCVTEARPLAPSDLQRQFRLTYTRAVQLLEELEADLVLRRRADGLYDTAAGLSVRRRSPNGRLTRNKSLFHGKRSAEETCESCGWSLPPGIHARHRSGVHAHHVIPVISGGSDFPDNRLFLCPNCHTLAHALFPRINGAYTGPRTKAELLHLLRFAEQEPEAFLAQQRFNASQRLPRNNTPKPQKPETPQPDTTPQPNPQKLSLHQISPTLQRLHLREKHGGSIFHCPTCFSRVAAAR